MTTSLVKVPFNGDVLEAVRDDKGVWVSLRRLCENLGIDFSRQLKKLKSEGDWATVDEMSTVAEDGKSRSMAMLHLDSVPLWLGGIMLGKVKPEVRDKLARYKKECARVLADHFFGSEKKAAPGLNAADVVEIVTQTLARVLPTVLAQRPAEIRPILTLETVASRITRLLPHWRPNARQRALVRQRARQQAKLATGSEPLCDYPGSQLEFLPEMHHHLDTAIWQTYREACRDNEVDNYGLFA